MQLTKEFSQNEWVESDIGIGQVIANEKYVVEEFFSHKLPELNIGDIYDNKIVYKVFCNYDCVPRGAKYICKESSEYLNEISTESLELRDKCIKKFPNKYSKFQKIEIQKNIIEKLDFPIKVAHESRTEITNKINELLLNLDNKLTYDEISNLILNNVKGINSETLIFNDVMDTNILISLKYDYLNSNNGKFSFFSGLAVQTYHQNG